MKDIVLFGAGKIGRTAAAVYLKEGISIRCFVDNNAAVIGKEIMGIPVMDFSDFYDVYGVEETDIILSCSIKAQQEVILQLENAGITKYYPFRQELLLEKERIISYSYPTENEDIILYHILKNIEMKDIFYIDVGSNDPYIGSVTKLFYDQGACGINIDVESEMVRITEMNRPKDVNLCIGISNKIGRTVFYSQGAYGGLSTMVKENIQYKGAEKHDVAITTLEDICKQYVGSKEITFLKIDVEGKEREVLEGADFKHYRPYILVIESTLPCTDIPNYEGWESIVLSQGYHYVYAHGVNRYYVADEMKTLDKRFIPWNCLAANYCIFHSSLLYCI